MHYDHITEGIFIERPNRFIAYVDINGQTEVCHVKNTGRCRELLVPGAKVYLQDCGSQKRKTRYDLIAVEKNGLLINMDSQAPNKVVAEWLKSGGLHKEIRLIKPESTFNKSRFDFYIEWEEQGELKKGYIEVKGVTLEDESIVRFPDAPTERGVKHVMELCECIEQGYQAYVVFVIQMKGVRYFEPNWKTHPAFGEALLQAEKKGVQILAYDCLVERDSLVINEQTEVRLSTPLSAIVQPLLDWYDANKRVLPWRDKPSPYNVWVSEIMLQQTRVEAVKPYYERFLKELPDVEALAFAKEEKLLKLWEGLGYYNRVRNMQKAARIIVEEYGKELPADYELLTKLPGIGSYTAGAVASIAYGIKAPAVDGNVLRVISRVAESYDDILKQSVKKEMEKKLMEIMPDRPGAFNQALMELGAMVCVPNGQAKCVQCPLADICVANRKQIVDELPKKAPKKPRRVEKRTILILKDGEKVGICKRPDKGLLAGLYEFPGVPGHLSEEEALAWVKKQNYSALRIQKLEPAKHIFSHVEWNMIGYAVKIEEPAADKKSEKIIFVEPQKTERDYPIPSAFAAYTKYMNIRLGNEKYED